MTRGETRRKQCDVFTGIIEELGTIRAVHQGREAIRFDIAASGVLGDAVKGDSIAVNGVCLTAIDLDETGFRADVMPESLDRTTLGALRVGAHVNLERPMRLGGRLDGHIVQGHVDGVAKVLEATRQDDGGYRVRVVLDASLTTFLVQKGSITIDGVSLTIAELGPDWFEVAIIPHTLDATTLGGVTAGDEVNLEVDVIAKYVARNMRGDSEEHT
jgi:riboflavin synthase